MARFLMLVALLVTMLVIAACGPQGSEWDAPSESRQTQAEPASERAAAEDEAAKSTQENARRSEESSGLSVTTIEGEKVKLGAQGHVTALFFMAGW